MTLTLLRLYQKKIWHKANLLNKVLKTVLRIKKEKEKALVLFKIAFDFFKCKVLRKLRPSKTKT